MRQAPFFTGAKGLALFLYLARRWADEAVNNSSFIEIHTRAEPKL
jgi:hypothetical protein